MHHALEIQEILSDIFSLCSQCDAAALARTCRTFKEPALDALWKKLEHLGPLAQCLPEAACEISSDEDFEHSFSRPLTPTEWDILRSYTRRIRSILDFGWGLAEESIRILSAPSTTESLFPNLRSLGLKYTTKVVPLLPLISPYLTSLDLEFEDQHTSQEPLELFPEFFPNIRSLRLDVDQPDDTFSEFVSDCISRWKSLRSVVCPRVSLNVDDLGYLSVRPALTRLDFSPSLPLPTFYSHFAFSNLRDMTLRSESLEPISWLLSRTRLPAIMDFTAFITSSPSKQDLSSFWAGVQSSSAGRTVDKLRLSQCFPFWINIVRSEDPLLGLEDLRPCMAFSNLRRIDLDIEWNVGLTDNDLLTMVSAWPYLERLVVNADWGWNSLGGITPNGLLKILQKCPSLHWIALALDTRGHTELPPSGLILTLGLALRYLFYLNVLDSIIESESVPAVTAFFTSVANCSQFSCFRRSWKVRSPEWEVYMARWDNVFYAISRHT